MTIYFMPACFAEFCPGARRVRFRIELLGQLLVFGDGNAFFLHGPFVAAQHAIQAEVNEHSEARLMPPFHAAVAIFDRGSSGTGGAGLLGETGCGEQGG